jgi:hypothetical protein
MKTLKIALGSFLVGAALSVVPMVAYASCDPNIWVQDPSDCHVYHRYELVGSNCGDGVCVCAYMDSGGCVHRESDCSEDGPVS